MVNMQGAGDAYARRYIQNTFVPQHIKTKPAPQHTQVFGGGQQHCNTTVNYKVQVGPGGFWGGALGFLNGFMSTTQNTNLFGNNWNLGVPNQTQMNPTNPANTDKLANLKTLFPKFNIVSDGNGKYSATNSDGELVGQGLSYEDMCKVLGEKNGKTKSTDDTKVDNTKVDDKKVDDKKVDDTKVDDTKVDDTVKTENTTVTNHPPVYAQEPNGSKGSGKIKLPGGWYRAANDRSSSVNNTHNADGSGKNASQITSDVLGTKLKGVLSAEAQADLRADIIKYNPSVFNEDGSPKEGADYSKLDVPSMDYLIEAYGLEKGEKYHKQDDIYSGQKKYETKNGDYMKQDKNGKYGYYNKDGSYMSEKDFKAAHPTVNTGSIKKGGYSSQQKQFKSSTGRTAQFDGKEWHYYAKDGTELNKQYIQKVDPKLYKATQPKTKIPYTTIDQNNYGM